MGKHTIIKEARCSFPQLYGKDTRDDQTFNPGITLILEKEKHAATIAEVKAEIKAAIAGNPKLKKQEPTGERLCLRLPDRDELKYKAGNLILKANSQKPPLVLDADLKEMTEETDKIYSGCYVNAKIEIWGQANKWGRRVNAKLIAVQFVNKEADSFDGSYVAPEVAAEGFESLESDPSGGGFLDDGDGDGDDLLS